MCKHIRNYLTHKKYLCEQQSGFISGLSTDISVVKILKYVHDGLDANKFGISIFLDLLKAFVKVNKHILLSKLFTYGIRGLTHQLLRSCLENRQQYVTINSTKSHTSPIGMGVPQGYNIEPLLFLIFINEIVKSSSLLKLNLFPDDTSIYFSDCNEFNLYIVTNVELVKVCNWILDNKLALNIDKTLYLLFSGKKPVTSTNHLYMFDSAICRKNETYFLGLLLMTNSLGIFTQKMFLANKLIGPLFRVSDCFTLGALKTLYYSFIHP